MCPESRVMSRTSNLSFENAIHSAFLGMGGALLQLGMENTQQGKFMNARELVGYLIPGDLVEFDRGSYNHWAMYSDVHGYVFNISSEDKNENRAKITLEKLVDVAKGSLARRNNKESSAMMKGLKAKPKDKAIHDARLVLNKSLPYNFFKTNCEFYCTKWKYGTGFTDQVERPLLGVEGGIGAVLGGIIGGPPGALIGYAAASSITNVATRLMRQ